jgi:hypothetical protein
VAVSTLLPELTLMRIVCDMTAATSGGHIRRTHGRFAMAVNTQDAVVRAVEAEAGMQVMVERRHRPAIAVMAVTAGATKRPFMHVVLAVAIDAAALGIVETIAGMTGTARDRRMQADQGESGEIMVETNRLLPRLLRMTLKTVFTELAGVRVVYSVARTATIRHRLHCRRLVARSAVQLAVRADKIESRGIMIERRVWPENRPMAVVALMTVSTLMNIFAAMTVHTAVFKNIFEVLPSVAIIAL